MKNTRQPRIVCDFAYIPLTNGLEAIIDATDIHLVQGFNWSAIANKHNTYAGRCYRYSGRMNRVLMHRVLMGNPSGFEIDHINGNGLDNRRSNLRLATASENRQNQRLSKHNTSGFKGVTFIKRSKKWKAQISVNKKRIHLGSHETPESAYEAYCEASKKFHGEFSRLF